MVNMSSFYKNNIVVLKREGVLWRKWYFWNGCNLGE